MIATEHCVSLYKETQIDLIESSSVGSDLYWKPDHRKQKEGGGEGEGERVGRDEYFAQSPVPSPTQHNGHLPQIQENQNLLSRDTTCIEGN